jgi:hypothetical protein
VLQTDVRDAQLVLKSPEVQGLLDFDRPIGVLMVALLHFVQDDEDPWGIVRTLVSALPAGSYLVLSHATFDPLDQDTIAAMDRANAGIVPKFCPRPLAEVTRFFDGLELLEPGIVTVSDWRPEPDAPRLTPAEVTGYAGVAKVGG